MQAQDHWTASGQVPSGVQGRCPRPHTIPLGFCPGPWELWQGQGAEPTERLEDPGQEPHSPPCPEPRTPGHRLAFPRVCSFTDLR